MVEAILQEGLRIFRSGIRPEMIDGPRSVRHHGAAHDAVRLLEEPCRPCLADTS